MRVWQVISFDHRPVSAAWIDLFKAKCHADSQEGIHCIHILTSKCKFKAPAIVKHHLTVVEVKETCNC
jgi:hypothetical protein